MHGSGAPIAVVWWPGMMAHSNRTVGIVILLLVGGCSSEGGGAGQAGSGGSGLGSAGDGGSNVGTAGAGGTSDAGGLPGADAASGDGPAPAVGNCSPPDDIYSPIQSLSLTGCVDPQDPTKP